MSHRWKYNAQMTDSEINELEEFMIARNMKISKNDISNAARHLNLSIKRALIYFEDVKNELEKNKMDSNEKMVKKIKKICKKLDLIEKYL